MMSEITTKNGWTVGSVNSQTENDEPLVNDLKALVSQLNEKILKGQQRGFRVNLTIDQTWIIKENFVRQEIQLKVWREVV